VTAPERLVRITAYRHEIRVSVRHGTGRPVVMCSGIGASLELFQPFVDALDPSIPVVRFDVPGVGGSPPPLVPYSYAGLSLLLGRTLTRLGFAEVDVLGISWGGGLAQQFAFQNPRRVRRVVLVSTATGALMVPGKPKVLSKMITPRRYRDAAYAARIAGTIYGGTARAHPTSAMHALHDQSRVGSRRGYFLQILAGMGWTSLTLLPLIRQPVLVLAGDDDPIIPLVNARIMTRLLPRGRLHVFADGHLGLITRAPELAPVVAEFLRPIRDEPAPPSVVPGHANV
jgi:poly(3-hydroxyalkanoate) depolymerase